MTRERFPALDGLRALGALAVLTTHVGFHSGDAVQGPFAALLARLDVGVAVFFAISGFLLYRPHAVAWFAGTEPPRVLPYLRNRALRILPVLWVAVILTALVLPHESSVTWDDYLRHATLTHVYVDGVPIQELTQLWSLAVEVTFYLLLPLIARLLTSFQAPTRRAVRGRLAALAGLAVVGPLWMAGTAVADYARAGLWLPGYLGWFAVGMGLALWQVARTSGRLRPSGLDTLVRAPGTIWAIAGALLVIAGTPIAGPYALVPPSPGQAFVKSLLYTVIAAGVLLPAIMPADRTHRAVAALGGRVGRVAGDISYSVFAYHLVVLGVVERLMDYQPFTGDFARLFWPTLVVACALGLISYYGMERPIMRLGRRDPGYDVSPEGRASKASAQPNSTSA